MNPDLLKSKKIRKATAIAASKCTCCDAVHVELHDTAGNVFAVGIITRLVAVALADSLLDAAGAPQDMVMRS